jgi:hypothetical protein
MMYYTDYACNYLYRATVHYVSGDSIEADDIVPFLSLRSFYDYIDKNLEVVLAFLVVRGNAFLETRHPAIHSRFAPAR